MPLSDKHPVVGLTDDQPGLADTAKEAWLYGLILIESARTRQGTIETAGVNALLHHRKLSSPSDRWVTSPNNDTIYSAAWLDLAAGPATIDLPATGERYASYAFMDMYGRNFAVLGTRTTGGAARRVTLVGPAGATSDPLAVRSPTRWVWFLARFLVDGSPDLPAVHALQDAIRISARAGQKPAATASSDADWKDYFASVSSLIAENPPPVSDLRFFRRIAALGLGPSGGFDAARFNASEQAAIARGADEARALARQAWSGPIINGWVYPAAGSGLGQDYLRRARIAASGLGGLPPQEAIYLRHSGTGGSTHLPADRAWLLEFPANALPPVDAFWSLSMYGVAPDAKRYFYDNPIGRYSIGDRTSDLARTPSGAIRIWMAREAPPAGNGVNWLPLPPTEYFSVTLRAYLPKPEFIRGDYKLPPLLPLA